MRKSLYNKIIDRLPDAEIMEFGPTFVISYPGTLREVIVKDYGYDKIEIKSRIEDERMHCAINEFNEIEIVNEIYIFLKGTN